MSLMHRLLFRLSAHLRCRCISGPGGEPYLERYHLLRLPFGIHCYLHRFVGSDPGRALHNHPWRHALSLVLAGHYVETRLQGRGDTRLRRRRIAAGRINRIGGHIYHRIDLPQGVEAWSLFLHTASERSWGFLDTRARCFRYTDHQFVLGASSNPDWWRKFPRPRQNPAIRRAECDGSSISPIPPDANNPL